MITTFLVAVKNTFVGCVNIITSVVAFGYLSTVCVMVTNILAN